MVRWAHVLAPHSDWFKLPGGELIPEIGSLSKHIASILLRADH